MLRVIGFVSIVLVLCFHGKSSDAEEVCTCVAPDYHVVKIAQRGQFDEECKNATEALPCFQNASCTNSDKDWLDGYGLTEGISYLCSEEARQVFLDNIDCATTAGESDAFKSCVSEAKAKAKAGDDNCRRFEARFKCAYEQIKAQCSEDAAHVFIKFQTLLNGRTMSNIDCTVDTSYLDSGFSRLSSSVTSLVLLPLLSLMSLMFIGR